MLDWAEAVLYNGLARYEEARSAALRVFEHPDLNPSTWGMPEVIEAAVRAGTPELAADVRSRLVAMARVSGTDWALGLAARSEALFADDQRAEELYVEAVDRLGRTRIRADLARAHLLYGEWLRRQRRRLDAREQLRTAHDLFSDFGMEAFAERARVELEATGEHARKRTVDTLVDLTPQEAQISRLVARETRTGDRRAAVHQQAHRRVPPPQGLRQARHQLAHQAGTGPAARARRTLLAHPARTYREPAPASSSVHRRRPSCGSCCSPTAPPSPARPRASWRSPASPRTRSATGPPRGLALHELASQEASLEEAFMEMTHHAVEDPRGSASADRSGKEPS